MAKSGKGGGRPATSSRKARGCRDPCALEGAVAAPNGAAARPLRSGPARRDRNVTPSRRRPTAARFGSASPRGRARPRPWRSPGSFRTHRPVIRTGRRTKRMNALKTGRRRANPGTAPPGGAASGCHAVRTCLGDTPSGQSGTRRIARGGPCRGGAPTPGRRRRGPAGRDRIRGARRVRRPPDTGETSCENKKRQPARAASIHHVTREPFRRRPGRLPPIGSPRTQLWCLDKAIFYRIAPSCQ